MRRIDFGQSGLDLSSKTFEMYFEMEFEFDFVVRSGETEDFGEFRHPVFRRDCIGLTLMDLHLRERVIENGFRFRIVFGMKFDFIYYE